MRSHANHWLQFTTLYDKRKRKSEEQSGSEEERILSNQTSLQLAAPGGFKQKQRTSGMAEEEVENCGIMVE
jgi:hypothetical protein